MIYLETATGKIHGVEEVEVSDEDIDELAALVHELRAQLIRRTHLPDWRFPLPRDE